jgi:hypothetical protein
MASLLNQRTPTGLVIAQTIGITLSAYVCGAYTRAEPQDVLTTLQYTHKYLYRLKCVSLICLGPSSDASSSSAGRKAMVHGPYARR